MQSEQDESLPPFHMLLKASLDADLADLIEIVGRIVKVIVPLVQNDARYERALEDRGIERSGTAATDLQVVADNARADAAAHVAELGIRLASLETENARLRAQLETSAVRPHPSAVEQDDGGH